MLTLADEVTLRRLVGVTTFARAEAYARGGAVRSREWAPGGARVVGEVQGGALEPYRVSVDLTRSPSAALSALRASCTCPVGVNCKHAVALLLVPDAAAPAQDAPWSAQHAPPVAGGALAGPAPVGPAPMGPAPVGPALTLVRSSDRPARARVGSPGGRPAPAPAGWESPLLALLGAGSGDQPAVDGPPLSIGLQLELVMARSRPAAQGGPGPGIRLRPVVCSPSGNWVRTGISWNTLDYFGYGRSPGRETAEKRRVMKELLALSRLSGPRFSYSQAEPEVWLEEIHSRRVWDLLREAQDVAVPLLESGRPARPVTLRPTAASVTLDLTRTAGGFRLEPQVEVGHVPVPLASSLLLGRPAHGLAWWADESPTVAARPGRLHLASLAGPVDDTLGAFLHRGPVLVPQRDAKRFAQEFFPVLRRRVAVISSDRSVELPEAPPAALVLSVHHEGGHRIALSWTRGHVGTGTREGLRVLSRRGADRGAEDQVTALLQGRPGLTELTPFGERLAETARLEGMAAVGFCADVLPALLQVAGVEIEHVGAAPDYREAEAAPVVRLGGSESDDGDWLDLTVNVTVGDEEVPFQELFVALAEGASHLILPSGTYFSLDRDELRHLAELIAEARALNDASPAGVRLSRFQASLWEDLQRVGVVTAQAGRWDAAVRALAEASDRTDHPTPASLHAILRPYQQVGFNWLAYLYQHRLGGVLADDMGLGKTLQALALMCHAQEQGGRQPGGAAGPFLVVAPTSVVGNWAAECRRFAPDLEVVMISGTETRRGVRLDELAATADVVITSYALFRLEYEAYEAIEWAGLFLDEAQFAKNRASQTYRRARTLPVVFKVAMTGTPMENNLMELWSLLSITAPGLFPSPERFERHFRAPIEKGADADRLDQLRRRVRPLLLRRTKEQVATDLPDKQEQVLELELNPRQRKLYQTYLARERQKILGLLGDMDKNRFQIFRSLTLLRQASLDVSLVDAQHGAVPSTKLDALMEMLTDIVADGHRVLVFSQFTRFLGEARRRIEAAGIGHCYLDGRTRHRAAVIGEFRTGAAPVFLISLKAGGFGLNLTEADYCILLDPWWNPATEAQAVDRIHRIGQTRKVMVYRLVARDTIEEKVMALKARKAALFANVVDAGGFESGALTAADIRGLLG
jgi:superfamily II DNA or RNA helicase